MEWDLLIIFIVYIRRRVCFMNKKLDYSLYLVTDRSVLGNKSLEESIKNAILGGVTVVQLREKMVSSMEFYNIARSEEHTSELQSRQYLVCRLLLEKTNKDHC